MPLHFLAWLSVIPFRWFYPCTPFAWWKGSRSVLTAEFCIFPWNHFTPKTLVFLIWTRPEIRLPGFLCFQTFPGRIFFYTLFDCRKIFGFWIYPDIPGIFGLIWFFSVIGLLQSFTFSFYNTFIFPFSFLFRLLSIFYFTLLGFCYNRRFRLCQ